MRAFSSQIGKTDSDQGSLSFLARGVNPTQYSSLSQVNPEALRLADKPETSQFAACHSEAASSRCSGQNSAI